MTEFSVENVFEARVSEKSLRDARAQVEDKLGDIEVDVAASVDSGGGGDRAARDRAMGRQLQDQQLEALSEIQEGLDNEQTLDEWETEHELSRDRNLLLEQLLEQQEKDSFDRALRGGGGVAGLGAVGAIGGLTAVGGGLISFLQGFEFEAPTVEPPDIPPLEVPTIPPVDVPEPEWLPPTVPQPEWLPIDIPEVGTAPASEPTPNPSAPPAPDTPPNPDIDDIQDPTGVDEPAPAPVPLPDNIQDPGPVGGVESPVPEPAPTGDGGLLEGLEVNAEDVLAGGAGAAGVAALSKFLSGAGETVGGTAGVLAGLPGNLAARSADRSQTRPEDQQTVLDRLIGDALEAAGVGDGATAAGAATAATVGTNALAGGGQTNTSNTNRAGERRRSGEVRVDHSPTYEVRDLRELKRKQEQDRRELEQKIKNLQNSFR